MDEICVLGKVLILVIVGCVAFVVLAIPLFYTVITRWLTADGAPVIDAEGMVASGATVVADTVPVAAKTADPAKSVEAPVAAPVAVAAKKRDDLKALPGLLAEMEAKLNHAGVSSFEELASLSDVEVGAIGDAISFRNRATWNAWRAKAGELAG